MYLLISLFVAAMLAAFVLLKRSRRSREDVLEQVARQAPPPAPMPEPNWIVWIDGNVTFRIDSNTTRVQRNVRGFWQDVPIHTVSIPDRIATLITEQS